MRTAAALAAVVLATATAGAQRQTLLLNPDASEVKITLNTTHEVVHGTFHLQSGSIEFDRSAPKLSGSVVVAAVGNTGNGSHDKKMNNDILKSGQYATVSFEPRSYAGGPGRRGRLDDTGDGDLHAARHAARDHRADAGAS